MTVLRRMRILAFVPVFAAVWVVAVATPSARGDDYWIVSSRCCKQHNLVGCVSCRFGYYRCAEGCCAARQPEAAFQAWLRPDVPLCIVTHGSFTSIDDLQYRSRHMYRWIRSAAPDRPLQVVFFSWPSDLPLLGLIPVDIGVLGRRSAFNGMYLAQLISQIPGDRPICLLAHSHGARASSAALHLLAGGRVQGHRFCRPETSGRRMRAVFLAAALDHHWLNPGERYDRALCRLEALLNVRNHRDSVLHFYPLRRPCSRKALGYAGLSQKDRRRMGWQSLKVTEIDVAPLIGSHHYWQYYYGRPDIAAAIAPYVFFPEIVAPPVTVPAGPTYAPEPAASSAGRAVVY